MPISISNIKKSGVKLLTLTTFPEVLDMAVKLKKVKETEREAMFEWLKDPAQWGKKMGFEK